MIGQFFAAVLAITSGPPQSFVVYDGVRASLSKRQQPLSKRRIAHTEVHRQYTWCTCALFPFKFGICSADVALVMLVKQFPQRALVLCDRFGRLAQRHAIGNGFADP